MDYSVKILRWQPAQRNSRLGFLDIELVPPGIKIYNLTVNESHEKVWVGMPSAARLTNDRELVKIGGKIQYAPVVQVANKERPFFNEIVLTALEEHNGGPICDNSDPNLFDIRSLGRV